MNNFVKDHVIPAVSALVFLCGLWIMFGPNLRLFLVVWITAFVIWLYLAITDRELK